MKILVTGKTGLIGQDTAEWLDADGHEVVSVSLRDWQTKGIPPQALERYDVLVHCAWGHGEHAERNSVEAQAPNVTLFKELIKARHGLVVSIGSQAEIYQPNSAYAQAKAACLDALRSKETDWLWLRGFTIYGPRQSNDWLIPNTIRHLLRNHTMDLTMGEQTMDFLHAHDMTRAINHGIMAGCYGIYEVGSGQSVSLAALVKLLVRLTGSKSELRFGALPYRADQIMEAKSNPFPFRMASRWWQSMDLRTGLQTVVDYIKSNG